MVWASAFVLFWAALIFFLLVPHPETKGIQIQEMTEQEALIETAADPKVFTMLIRPRVETGTNAEEIVREVKSTTMY